MLALFAVLGLTAGGCYSPSIPNGGFACQPTDDPPCPSGFYCVNGLCLDKPAGAVDGGDMSVADMSILLSDFATGPDLSKTADLASMPDLSSGGSCGMSGDECITQRCCAGYLCFLFSCI